METLGPLKQSRSQVGTALKNWEAGPNVVRRVDRVLHLGVVCQPIIGYTIGIM